METEPVVALAVKTPAVAIPLASVFTVMVLVALEKVPLAPEAGAVKVTEMPEPTG